MNKLKLAWAAGFFEGEGSVHVQRLKGYRGRCTYFYARISVSQTERAQLEELQRMFGGKIYERPKPSAHNWKPSWSWQIQGEPAIAAYEAMEPYFVGNYKREQFAKAMVTIEQNVA